MALQKDCRATHMHRDAWGGMWHRVCSRLSPAQKQAAAVEPAACVQCADSDDWQGLGGGVEWLAKRQQSVRGYSWCELLLEFGERRQGCGGLSGARKRLRRGVLPEVINTTGWNSNRGPAITGAVQASGRSSMMECRDSHREGDVPRPTRD